MTAEIIGFSPAGDKARGPISVDVVLQADGKPITGHLSNLEREVVKYALADQVAVALRSEGDAGVTKGHKTALYAHLVSIMHREGPEYARACMSLAAGMAGLMTREIDPEPQDPTDWSEIV